LSTPFLIFKLGIHLTKPLMILIFFCPFPIHHSPLYADYSIFQWFRQIHAHIQHHKIIVYYNFMLYNIILSDNRISGYAGQKDTQQAFSGYSNFQTGTLKNYSIL